MTSFRDTKAVAQTLLFGKRLFRSVWFFPVVLAIPLLIFTVLQIHGSSIGMHHQILYGVATEDKDIIANQPRGIRSDEWLVNSQKIIAQAENGYPLVNSNLGEGENMSVIIDVPYKEWSVLFKPHNLSFFLMPFDNAFAFRWWVMGYLLIVSCYFFVLALLPGKRLLAASISLALFFSAFVQWWYVYGTLASLYYPLFIATAAIYLCKQRERWKRIALGAALSYLMVCFAIILYPPFQIACGLVLLGFLAGYFAENFRKWGRQQTLRNALFIGASGLAAVAIVGLFVLTRLDVVKVATNTAYPGQRSIQSGGIHPEHLVSSHLGYQFTNDARVGHYLIDGKSPTNQSESSNFLLLIPFLFLPSLYLLYHGYKRKQTLDWPLLILNALFIVFLLECFVTQFTPISKLLLLDKVGGARLLIGLGLLNVMTLVLFIRNLSRKQVEFPRKLAVIYSLIVLAVMLAVSLRAHWGFDEFISLRGAVLFALPLPLVVYGLLRKRFLLAALLYFVFSFFISFRVNPLYQGVSSLTDDPLSTAIEQIGATSDKRWVSDGGYLQHVASINGEPSLSGVYDYPQLDLWDDIRSVREADYNRYAHVGFQVTDDRAVKTNISLVSPDSFVVRTYSCGDFLRKNDVGFVITSAVLKSECTTMVKAVPYPSVTLYIYSLK